MTRQQINKKLSTTAMAMALVLMAPPLAAQTLIPQTTPTAQIQQLEDRIVYNPTFFDEFSPLNASEMVSQVPGFALRSESGARGFSQGQGNLLINGKRPSTKSSSASGLLSRIPTSMVLRVELLKQGSSELAGQSGLIVNVVTKDQATVSGSWNAQTFLHEEEFADGDVRISMARTTEKTKFTAEVRGTHYGGRGEGPEQAYDNTGELIELRDEKSRWTHKEVTANLGWGWKGENGQLGNLSFQGNVGRMDGGEISDHFAPDADDGFGVLNNNIISDYDTKMHGFEFGGDYAASVLSGTAKIVGLYNYNKNDNLSEYSNTPAGGTPYLFNAQSPTTTSEAVLRSLYTFNPRAGDTIEFAVEGALNTLETSSVLEENTGGGFMDITLAGSDTRIEEKRGESSFLYVRSLGKNLTFRSTAAVEYSEISVKGTDGGSRSYWRPKGFVALTYNSSKNSQFRARIDRKVGQLNFNVFASTLDLLENTTDQGNTLIVPEQTWRFEVSNESRFGKNNVATLTLYHDQIEDLITFGPLATGGSGFANLDNSYRQGIDLNLRLTTDGIGLMGGRLDLSGGLRKSRFNDPVTDVRRPIDNDRPWTYSLNFRQDVPDTKWAWGFEISDNKQKHGSRSDQLLLTKSAPFYAITLIHKDFLGMNLMIMAHDFLGRHNKFSREFYSPDRTGSLMGSESRNRYSGPRLHIALSKRF